MCATYARTVLCLSVRAPHLLLLFCVWWRKCHRRSWPHSTLVPDALTVTASGLGRTILERNMNSRWSLLIWSLSRLTHFSHMNWIRLCLTCQTGSIHGTAERGACLVFFEWSVCASIVWDCLVGMVFSCAQHVLEPFLPVCVCVTLACVHWVDYQFLVICILSSLCSHLR